ncbi:hypothetical protein OAO87_02515 [bacterium]|nr:hypothetical protein [bacterium]
MPKATPSKEDLPKAPPRVREVKDTALMAQRVAEYDRLYAIYEEKMKAYKEGQRAGDQEKKAAKRRSGKAAAAEESGERTPKRSSASPSPRQPTPSPSPKQPKRNMHASPSKQPPDAQPMARKLAAAVVSGDADVEQHAAFSRQDLARRVRQLAWAEDVARYAEQAGMLTAPLLYANGDWCAHRGRPAAHQPVTTCNQLG